MKYLDRFWRLFSAATKNLYRLSGIGVIAVVLGLLAFEFALYVLLGKREDRWTDLYPNLLAGGLDAVITIVLLNWLLAKKEMTRLRPLKFGCYLELRMLVVRFCGLWVDMVKASSCNPPPAGSDLFDQRFVAQVVEHLDLRKPSGTLGQDWAMHIISVTAECFEIIERIMRRYPLVMTEEITRLILEIERGAVPRVWLHLIAARQAQIETVFADKLIVTEDFVEVDVERFKQINEVLFHFGSEFVFDKGYFPPFDLTFKTDISLMNERDDIAPKLGSARR